MVWCPMITAQWVIVQRVAGREIPEAARTGVIRHFEVTRAPDGSWGLHPESHGYVFVTALAYVALRILGVGPDSPLVADARRWLHEQPGGVLAIPTWGKFWLAMLDLYGWDGVTPSPPELWLLPRALPFHPVRYYCHTRAIYLAESRCGVCGLHCGPGRASIRRACAAAPSPCASSASSASSARARTRACLQ